MEKPEHQNKHLKWIKRESKENYLKAIYLLGHQKMNGVRYAELEEYFGFSKASVCKAIRALRDEGFVVIDSAYCISLTEQGKYIGERTYEKYCFFRELLIKAGVETKKAETEADKLEHGISYTSLGNLNSIYAGTVSKSQ